MFNLSKVKTEYRVIKRPMYLIKWRLQKKDFLFWHTFKESTTLELPKEWCKKYGIDCWLEEYYPPY